MATVGRAGKSAKKLAVALRGKYIHLPSAKLPPNSHTAYSTKKGKTYNGYIRVGVKNHPFIPDGWMFEHWYVLSHYSGRFLKNPIAGVKCCIHHYDGNIENNARKNLRLLPFSVHQSHHLTGLRRSAATREKMGAWQRGKTLSAETRKRISETRKLKFGGT